MGTDGPTTTEDRKVRWLSQFESFGDGLTSAEPEAASVSPDIQLPMFQREGRGVTALPGPLADRGASLFKAHIPTQDGKRRIGGELSYIPDQPGDEFFYTKIGGMGVLSRVETSKWTSQGARRNPKYARKGGGLKQQVKEFTTRSRRRMSQQLAQVDWRRVFDYGIGAHLVLTYPSEFPCPRKAAEHMEAWRERMRRVFGSQLFGFWKKEPQERGAPHYHLLLVVMNGQTCDGCGDYVYEVLRDVAIRSWVEVVGSDDPAHAVHHWRDRKVCQRVREWEHVVRYVGKYVGKPTKTDGWDQPGRFWGKINRRALTVWVQGRCYRVPRKVWYDLRRTLRKHLVRSSSGSRTQVAARVRRSLTARGNGTWRHFLPCNGNSGLRNWEGPILAACRDGEWVSKVEGFI